MEQLPKIKLTRSPELDEAKKITDDITKKLFKNYMPIPITTSNTPICDMDAYETIEDLCAINNIVHKIILRRNASYSKNV